MSWMKNEARIKKKKGREESWPMSLKLIRR